MPNVQVGSVIDIHYYFPGIPYSWYFQRDIPVVWSELRMPEIPEVGIQKSFFGFESFAIAEKERWACKDVPSLREEPYMNDIDNYLTKFEMELSYINLRNFFQNYITSWDMASFYLLSKTSIGEKLQTPFFMNTEAKAIQDSFKTDKERLFAAYDLLKKKIKWNGVSDILPQYNTSFKSVLKNGSGNSCELNLALVLLLRNLNIEANPIATSTRDNGMLSISLPSFNKLNYVIVQAKVDGKEYLMDATEPNLTPGYLPERCINGNGRVIVEKNSSWAELKAGGSDKKRQIANIEMNATGDISGNYTSVFSDYGGYLFRKNYSELNDKREYTKAIERACPGLKFSDSKISDIDSVYKPVTFTSQIEYSGNVAVSDSTIAFFPIIFDRFGVNPFKLEDRKMPVDFIHPFDYSCLYNYKIPEGYVVETAPKSEIIPMADKSGKCVYRFNATDSVVSVYFSYNLTKTVYTIVEYPPLKKWFGSIVAKEKEPIILRKK